MRNRAVRPSPGPRPARPGSAGRRPAAGRRAAVPVPVGIGSRRTSRSTRRCRRLPGQEDPPGPPTFPRLLDCRTARRPRQEFAPLLFRDHDPETGERERSSPVRPARRSPPRRAARSSTATPDGLPHDDFGTVFRDSETSPSRHRPSSPRTPPPPLPAPDRLPGPCSPAGRSLRSSRGSPPPRCRAPHSRDLPRPDPFRHFRSGRSGPSCCRPCGEIGEWGSPRGPESAAPPPSGGVRWAGSHARSFHGGSNLRINRSSTERGEAVSWIHRRIGRPPRAAVRIARFTLQFVDCPPRKQFLGWMRA